MGLHVYLQCLIILGNKTHAGLELVDSLLEVAPRLCGIGQVEGGIAQQFLEALVLVPQARLDPLAVDQEVLLESGQETLRSVSCLHVPGRCPRWGSCEAND